MRILVVEDDPTVGAALRQGLLTQGFDVDLVADGVDGLWLATEGRYALVILDLRLPSLNGYQVCARLRQRGVAVPVLVLTGQRDEYDEAEALDIGADDFLSKPFSFVVLQARIRALLRRQQVPLAQAPLTHGDLTFWRDSGHCSRAGRSITLTPRERALLELLMSQPSLVSKATALREVWGPDHDGDPNVVEVYVSYLRKKIDKAFPDCESIIETVRGSGYRLRPVPRTLTASDPL